MAIYHLSSIAEQDVIGIWLYIARDNIDAADRMVDRFKEVYETISRNPKMGESVEQYRPLLRRFPVDSYVIYYELQNDELTVARVLHGARDHKAEL